MQKPALSPRKRGAGLGNNLTFGLLNALGERIVTGHYAKRPFPTEAQLAIEFKVSRSVTREAVKMLITKGLISTLPKRGIAVLPSEDWQLFDTDVLNWLLQRKVSLDLVVQFMDLRAAIEPAAAELAAMRSDPAGLQAIKDAYERMQQADANHEEGLDSDIDFHVAILMASGNRFFSQFRDVVSTALRTSIRISNRQARRTADLPSHKTVMDAILKGNGPAARRAMSALITFTRNLIDNHPLGTRAGTAGLTID